MSDEEGNLDIFSQDVVRAFAASWASIDGKMHQFYAEELHEVKPDDPNYTGHYEGYMTEAQELLKRAGRRLKGRMDLWERLS